MANPIHQEIVLPGRPDEIFQFLTDAATFSAVTGGAPAEIEARAGGAFSLFGGRILGRQLEVEANRRLVQAWRAENWDQGHYSVVRIELRVEGAGTRLVMEQDGHPAAAHDHLMAGWDQMYWTPLTTHLR